MRWCYLLLLLSIVYGGSAQRSEIRIDNVDSLIKKMVTRKAQLFLLTRGTLSKRNMIGRMFNLNDTNSTHVAIGIVKNKKVEVFSVEDQASEQSQLKSEGIREFLFPADVFYVSIWLAKMKSREINAVSRICRKFQFRKIQFDYEFALNNGDRFYCSEFCGEVLNQACADRYQFKPIVKEISGLYQNVLGRSVFTYYPVDFFQVSNRFTKIAEFNFWSSVE